MKQENRHKAPEIEKQPGVTKFVGFIFLAKFRFAKKYFAKSEVRFRPIFMPRACPKMAKNNFRTKVNETNIYELTEQGSKF